MVSGTCTQIVGTRGTNFLQCRTGWASARSWGGGGEGGGGAAYVHPATPDEPGVRDLHGERWGRGRSALTSCNTERDGVSGVCKRNVGVAEERSTYILQGQTCRTSAGLQDNASGARVSHLLSVTPNGPNVSGSCTTRGGGDGGRSTYTLHRRIGRTSARSTWNIIMVRARHLLPRWPNGPDISGMRTARVGGLRSFHLLPKLPNRPDVSKVCTVRGQAGKVLPLTSCNAE